MKLSYVLAFLAMAAVMTFGQDFDATRIDQLRTYGTGVVLVPIDRAALTVTATGQADTASRAVSDSNDLQRRINETLANYTIIDVRFGGLYLEPLYNDGALSFAAHNSLSLVINAVDTPTIIDSMITLGASNISFIFTPDFLAVEKAQRQSLQLAVADGLFKAQAVLDIIDHCAYNISTISIRNPAMELPTLTFNIFANMGNRNNLRPLNISPSQGSAAPSDDSDRSDSDRNSGTSRPMMLGAASPLIEGDREEVVSYVEMWVRHSPCSLGGSGMLTDITSGLDLSNIVGIAGGILGSPVSSPIEGSPASEIGSPVEGSPLSMRSVRSTVW